MKVFLMHPNQDFDPEQLLPFNEAALTQDLELNILFHAMAKGDDFLFNVAKQAILTSLDKTDAICYRQDILKDCLKNPAIVKEIYHISIQSNEKQRGHWMGVFTKYPSGILSNAVQILETFIFLLKKLKKIADNHAMEFESEGFQRFFSMIQQELNDDYFAAVDEHLKALKFRNGVLISADLGTGNEGTNYLLRKASQGDSNWLKQAFTRKSPVYSFTLDPRDKPGARILGELRDKGVNLVANAVAQSADHIDSFLNMLRVELAFYIGCLNLSETLSQMGEPICIPVPVHSAERTLSFAGLFDVSLALTTKQKVIGNNVSAERKELVVITGANQGGKSTFLRSIGQAQLMMQCGMFAPAESFSVNVCNKLFTHYKREEDTFMKSGKFDEELGRMSLIVDHAIPDSMILFNESFSATNEREGSEIGRQIINALLERHIKVFFVTHLYELAHGFYDRNMDNAIFLRAERESDGVRSFKLAEGEPLQTSYGIDSYNKIFK